MTNRTDAVVQTLFGKPTLEACSLQQVEYLAQQYPYFSTAQILLVKKSGNDGGGDAHQLHRTALQFTNPLQLVFRLQPALFETGTPQPELFQNPIPPPEIATQPEPEPEVVPEPAVAETPLNQTTPAEPPPSLLPTADVVAEPPAAEKQPQATAPDITFEPFHTVDYFASQGIKLSQQEAGSDALSKQLKSFTEWLKTMKRLPDAAAPAAAETVSERKVENLAAHSLEAADVVTESMAEVWLKQGAIVKAIDVYNKLRLHNPAKSAYFAAKIESLKNNRT